MELVEYIYSQKVILLVSDQRDLCRLVQESIMRFFTNSHAGTL